MMYVMDLVDVLFGYLKTSIIVTCVLQNDC